MYNSYGYNPYNRDATQPLNTSITQKVEEEMSKIMVNGIDTNESIDRLYKLIDIHKDIANENY